MNASFLHELYLLTISGGVTVAVAVAPAVSDGIARARPLGSEKAQNTRKADLTLFGSGWILRQQACSGLFPHADRHSSFDERRA